MRSCIRRSGCREYIVDITDIVLDQSAAAFVAGFSGASKTWEIDLGAPERRRRWQNVTDSDPWRLRSPHDIDSLIPSDRGLSDQWRPNAQRKSPGDPDLRALAAQGGPETSRPANPHRPRSGSRLQSPDWQRACPGVWELLSGGTSTHRASRKTRYEMIGGSHLWRSNARATIVIAASSRRAARARQVVTYFVSTSNTSHRERAVRNDPAGGMNHPRSSALTGFQRAEGRTGTAGKRGTGRSNWRTCLAVFPGAGRAAGAERSPGKQARWHQSHRHGRLAVASRSSPSQTRPVTIRIRVVEPTASVSIPRSSCDYRQRQLPLGLAAIMTQIQDDHRRGYHTSSVRRHDAQRQADRRRHDFRTSANELLGEHYSFERPSFMPTWRPIWSMGPRSRQPKRAVRDVSCSKVGAAPPESFTVTSRWRPDPIWSRALRGSCLRRYPSGRAINREPHRPSHSIWGSSVRALIRRPARAPAWERGAVLPRNGFDLRRRLSPSAPFHESLSRWNQGSSYQPGCG